MLIVARTSSSELIDSESSVPEGSEGSKSSKLAKLLIFMHPCEDMVQPELAEKSRFLLIVMVLLPLL